MYSEVVPLFVLYALLAAAIAVLMRWKSNNTQQNDAEEEGEIQPEAEPELPSAANTLVTFRNLVIESDHTTPYTEIDELIVSPYGIFCVEIKARVGYIFGSYDSKQWTQCKYAEKVRFQNPLHQNHKHIKALEKLLGDQLDKTPIHNMVLFTNAHLVEVADRRVLMNREELHKALSRHTTQILTPEQYRNICEILAYESTMSDERMPIHIATLQQHLAQV